MMSARWDAIIVGAGPGGCAAAFDLASAGRRVLLLDRRSFPREKACAGGLTIKSLHALRYSVEPVIRRVCSDLTLGLRCDRRITQRGSAPIAVMTVRSELDAFCLNETLAQGVRFEKVEHLEEIEELEGHVRIRVDGEPLEATFLIGADGANSRVRRLCWGPGLAASNGFAIEGRVASRELGVTPMEFDFAAVDRGYGWLFPKGDHVNVGVYTWDPRVRLDRETLSEYARLRLGEGGKERIEHIVGHPIGLRRTDDWPATERITLVGDAAQAVDPLLGEGIYYAIWSGQEAAAAVLGGLEIAGGLKAGMKESGARIVRDLRTNWKAAERFYETPDRGYRVLSNVLVRRALMRGFGAGWTFSQTKHRFAHAMVAKSAAPGYLCSRIEQ